MLEFGLTGGIGSGKSTVSVLLAERGATIIDADAIVRDLQRPGELVFDAMVERWGQSIVQGSGDAAGALDRAAVAGIVFSDEAELEALNAIVHPAVAEETQRRLDVVAGTEAIVVHDIPLLIIPGGELLTSRDHTEWSGIIVIDTPEELAIDRVVASRGMDREAIIARMEAQATRQERRAVADFVIDNSGEFSNLEAEVERCWNWMLSTSGANSTGANETDGGAATPPAAITPTGLADPSDAEERAEPAAITPTGLADPSDAEEIA